MPGLFVCSGDRRADAILDLILSSLETVEPPTLGHLMLGFETGVNPLEWYKIGLLPRHEFSCLTVIIDQLQVGK